MILKNTGNTPAKFIHLSTKVTSPKGWMLLTPATSFPPPGRVGPKSERSWLFFEVASLTQEAIPESMTETEKLKAYREYVATHTLVDVARQPREEVFIDFSLTYEDVFGKQETLKWRSAENLD